MFIKFTVITAFARVGFHFPSLTTWVFIKAGTLEHLLVSQALPNLAAELNGWKRTSLLMDPQEGKMRFESLENGGRDGGGVGLVTLSGRTIISFWPYCFSNSGL